MGSCLQPADSLESDMGNSDPHPWALHDMRSPGRRARVVDEAPHFLLVRSGKESRRIAAVRAALERLPEAPDLEDIDELSDLSERLGRSPPPDVVLLEIAGPDSDEHQALEALATRHRAPLWVVLIPSGDEDLVKAILEHGADDYLFVEEIGPHALDRIIRYARRRRTAEVDLHEAAARYRILFERAPEGILVVDSRGLIQDVNPRLADLFGYEREELIGRPVETLVPEGMRDAHVDYRQAYVKAPVPRPMGHERNLRGRRRDGSDFPVEVGLAPLLFGGRDAVAATVRDLSAVEGRRRLADLVDASEDAILGVALNGTIESWNGGAARYFGLTRKEAVGRSLVSLLAPEVIEALPDILRQVRAGEHVRSIENFLVDPNGRHVHLSLSFSPLTDRTGEITGAGVIGRDITQRKILEADLEELAYQDPLTRVANRRFLRERLLYAMSLARREQTGLGLVYLDLSGFKQVNDRFGHPAGDAVLVEVARRLMEVVRESDLVARFGGDEFVILLSKVDDEEAALEAARRFEAALEPAIRVGEEIEVKVEADFGIALYPDHGTEADELLDAADRALYSRKEAGRRPEAGAGAGGGVGLATIPSFESRLRAALDQAQLTLYCQPITRASGGDLAGIEVLIRWDHPESGMLPAGRFLSSARDLGMMPEIDHWVVSRVLAAARDRGLPRAAWFAVNLSDQTLTDAEAVSSLGALIDDLGLPVGGLRIEVRESPAIVSPKLVDAMERLGARGATIVLDNYGVGHSALAQLGEIPADALKLDGMLVRELDHDAEAVRIIHAVIDLGVAAGLEVGVEGVERAGQAEHLHGDGCEFLQGYYFGRPVPLEHVLA
jgi:diguanylate cyclase (GGDEF)-like protein/PAS domain S-box-containing protein